MSVQLLRLIARALSWLPLGINQWIGSAIGRLAWALNGQLRRVTETNVRLCYPNMSETERHRLAHQSFIEMGKQITECAWIWHRPTHQTHNKIIETVGQDTLDEARRTGQGCILSSPHLGNWELCTLPLSQDDTFTFFYRSPRRTELDRVLLQWRKHLGGQPAVLNASGIKTGLKVLKSGGMLGILPDQEPDLANGLFAPLFNEPALTMTLLPKLAYRSGARVLFCVSERLPRGQGWRFHIIPAEPAVSDKNLQIAVNALNRGIEQCIAVCPEQYLWSYKRFNTLQDGSRRTYKH